MQVIEEVIGGTQVFIEVMDTAADVIGQSRTGRQTNLTSIQDQLNNTYDRAKSVIRSIASDVGQDFSTLPVEVRPRNVALEFNMGFSAGVGAWVLTGSGEFILKIRMSWEPGDNG